MEILKGQILEAISELGGILPLGPKAKAEEIQKLFKVRKKDYVEAVEALVKEGKVEVTPSGVQQMVVSTPSGRMFRKIRRKRR